MLRARLLPRGQRALRATVMSLLVALGLPSAAVGEDKRAAARLEAMANFLAKAQRLSVVADCSYDVVQDSGQKIEFGERRVMTLRRPDRARVDVTRRDGARRGLLFDGAQLTPSMSTRRSTRRCRSRARSTRRSPISPTT